MWRDRLIAFIIVCIMIGSISLIIAVANAKTIEDYVINTTLTNKELLENTTMFNLQENEENKALEVIGTIADECTDKVKNITVVWNVYEYCQWYGDRGICKDEEKKTTRGIEYGGEILVEYSPNRIKFKEWLSHEVSHANFPDVDHEVIYHFGRKGVCLN